MMRYKISLEQWSAIITWAIVSGFSLSIIHKSDAFSALYLSGGAFLCVVYIVLWLILTADDVILLTKRNQYIILVTLFIDIIAIYFVFPVPFVAIFMVIFSACTLYFVNLKTAIALSPILGLPFVLVYHYYWHLNGMIMTGFLFWTFNLFALVMVNTSVKEKEARLEAEHATRQLQATQGLLNEAVKQGERVRIARNIHDLLGHHLTALTINLQVASRQSSGETQKTIEQCHQLAKLLLSDVREAVTDIRDKSTLDLDESIRAMIANLPDINVTLNLEEGLDLNDIQVADAIIKSIQETITNTIRHAKGDSISIQIEKDGANNSDKPNIHINIQNNGKIPHSFSLGNGLRGIQERFTALGGSAQFSVDNTFFYTTLSVPVTNND